MGCFGARFVTRLTSIHPAHHKGSDAVTSGSANGGDGAGGAPDSSRPSELVTARYDVTGSLGHGAFADVWLCEERDTWQRVACKVIDTSPSGRGQEAIAVAPSSPRGVPRSPRGGVKSGPRAVLDRTGPGTPDGCKARGVSSAAAIAAREVAVLRLLSDKVEGITKLHEAHTSQDRVEIVMDYCPGGDLTGVLLNKGRLPERVAKVLFRQLASTLASCHAMGVLHRDIKPDNILFDGPNPEALFHGPRRQRQDEAPVHAVLADFGVATLLPIGTTALGDCGTKYFQAPEVVRGDAYGFEADVWSLGVVLYAMLAGSLPPSPKNHRSVHWFWVDILRGKANLDQLQPALVSSEGRSLVRAMLQANPAQRPSAFQLLSHPWVANCE